MKFLTSLVLQSVVSLVISYGLVSYVPLNYFPDVIKHTFGSTITTIQGSDTISGSRTTINTNFSNLNADKFETTGTTLASLTSAASLATVGTITSGTWHGGIVFPTWGGTGSSTLSSNQVILGNGTGAVNVVSGFGTSGQFLTSNGAAVAPTWQSSTVNQGSNYTWTGLHSFAYASTTQLTIPSGGIITVDSAATMNGVARTASTSVWTVSGTWNKPTGATAVFVKAWGGGASGANGQEVGSGGGGGGEYVEKWILASDVSSSVTITIGAGGAAVSTQPTGGNNGNATTFGTSVQANGGLGGGFSGNNGIGGDGGSPNGALTKMWGVGVVSAIGGVGNFSAAGGGGTQSSASFAGGASTWGGGGGGGSYNSSGSAGGVSTQGGSGGAGAYNATATDGSVPGGGGGANSGTGNSGAGGNGKMVVITLF